MAKGTKGGSVYVEIVLDKDQFNKDMKASAREITAMQKQLSLEMQRNKVKFEVDTQNKDWADKLFGNSVIGKIRQARRETEYMNRQIGFQQNKVDVASGAWQALVSSKGAMSAAAINAEKAFMKEQMALLGLQKQLDGTATASSLLTGTMKTTALAAAAAVATLATAYAGAVRAANEWGNAVNDLVDETGLADEEASRLLGTMNIIGIGAEDAAAAIAKMTKAVSAAAVAQATASKTGKESEDAFTKYGIAIRDADGVMLDHQQIILNIQEVHRGMRDGLEKTKLEMDLFGKSGYKMKDFLDLTADQMANFATQVDKAGATLKNSAQYEEFQRQLNAIQLSLKGIAITIVGDDIPALTAFLKKLQEIASWTKDNKEGIIDLRDTMLLIGGTIAKPFTIGMDAVVLGTKKAIEAATAYQKSLKEAEGASSETDFVSRQQQAIKNADELAARQTAINKARAEAENDLIDTQRALSDAVLTLQGKTLELTLLNIGREKEAWIKKTKDEVAATRWAEMAKLKAYQDAIDARLGPEVAAAKEAIKLGTDVGEAIRKASEGRKLDEKQAYDAKKAVQDYYGIKAPGDTKSTIIVDELSGVITQLREKVSEWAVPKDKYGRTVFDQYQPTPAGQVIPGQNMTITVNSNVNVTGMDKQSAQQLGEVAAQQIIPQVQQAVARAQTQYGGGK